jgi:Tol biopolymer transport system component
VWLADSRGHAELLYATDEILLEAPNWCVAGASLVLNGSGRLWEVAIGARPSLREIPITGVPDLNNDHVLSADGQRVYVSANDGHIYLAPRGGGAATRLTRDDGNFHFLHGVSRDGQELAYVDIPADRFEVPGRLVIARSDGSDVHHLDVGDGHADGPEFGPDDGWLYFNSETFSGVPGHAQLGRLSLASRQVERLVRSPSVDWFPHVAPNGRLASYVSFPPGTMGHPPDLNVAIHVVPTRDWSTPIATVPVFGGQGTLNVNSWSPDSARFAYVSYPVS